MRWWCGAKQTSKGLVLGAVLSAKVWCFMRVLGSAKQTNQAKVWLGVLCGFPVKKSISVGIKSMSERAGCGQFRMRCGCGAKQTNKQG
jgi:hypothetical protein